MSWGTPLKNHPDSGPADMIALQTITGKQQFCEEPTARNSNRLPQKGKGAVPGGPAERIAGKPMFKQTPHKEQG